MWNQIGTHFCELESRVYYRVTVSAMLIPTVNEGEKILLKMAALNFNDFKNGT